MESLSMILSVLCLLLSVTGGRAADEELRLEIEEAASDSRLLADELADMLARLEADDSRQEAVEAAVLGDDIKVESALQEMLDKIEKLETVANEDLETPELRGTLEEKIEKEEELRQTLETLETVARQIEDVSSVKDLKTIDDMTELLQTINDKIEDSVDAETGKTKSGVRTALHLNGIVDMIKSLEKVTTDLKSMQDNIDDYFDEDDNSNKNRTNEKLIKSGNEESKASKLLSSFFNSKSSENSNVEKKNRKGKQLDDDIDYANEEYEDFGGDYNDGDDAAVESDAKSGADKTEEPRSSGGGDSSKSSYASHDEEEEEICEETEAKSRVRVCTPKLSRVEEAINLYSSIPEDVRHCYDVSKTVCTESSQIVSKEVCIYGYTQNVVVAPVQSAEITFERKFKPFSVSKCSKTVIKDGYKDKEVEECVEEVKEIPYRLPSIVDNLDDFLELNIPEPEAQCQLYRYDVPEVMCRDTARRECSDMAFLSPVTTSHYIQTAKPSYEGNCRPQTLSLDQQKCKPPPPKKTKSYSTFYRL